MDGSKFLRANVDVVARIEVIKAVNIEKAEAEAKAKAEAVEKESTIMCLNDGDENIKCE